MSDPIKIPEIDPDAQVQHPHAPPVNLNGALPSEPTPSVKVTDEDSPAPVIPEQVLREKFTTGGNSGPAPYSSPEPIEAMFAQVRADIARQERMLMLTATTVIFLSLLLAYTVKKGGFVTDGPLEG
jgi:hypothetical protein